MLETLCCWLESISGSSDFYKFVCDAVAVQLHGVADDYRRDHRECGAALCPRLRQPEPRGLRPAALALLHSGAHTARLWRRLAGHAGGAHPRAVLGVLLAGAAHVLHRESGGAHDRGLVQQLGEYSERPALK